MILFIVYKIMNGSISGESHFGEKTVNANPCQYFDLHLIFLVGSVKNDIMTTYSFPINRYKLCLYLLAHIYG